MSEENKALARRSWEIVNQHNPDLIDEMYTPDFVWHEPDQDIQGSEKAKQFVSTFFEAFPDLNVTVEEEIAEDDKVVTRSRKEEQKMVIPRCELFSGIIAAAAKKEN